MTATPAAQTVQQLADKWIAKRPYQAERIHRAVALVDNVQAVDADTFTVEGSEGNRYTVKVDREHKVSTCTCPDYEKRQDRCKHIWAAGLFEAGQEAK